MRAIDHRGRLGPWRSLIAARGGWWALATIVVLGAAVRLVAIGSRLHADDAYTWLVASQPNAHAFLAQLAAAENTPPLSYLLLVPLPIEHPAWLRLPAAIAGILVLVVLFLALRRAFGGRAALLAALVTAVAPFLITYADLARGFMLADLAELVALWAVLRLSERESRGWWLAFVLAGVVALYTEYSGAIFLVALGLTALFLGRPRRRSMVLTTVVPFVALVPWIPQMVRGERLVGVTKLHPLFATPSLSELRNAMVTLALGENGGTASTTGRWLEFAVLLSLGAAAAFVLARFRRATDGRQRHAVLLIAGTGLLTVLGHALAPVAGVDVFSQRYMTILIPLAAALGAAALVALPWRWPAAAAAVGLVVLGAGELARRFHAEFEPSFAPVQQAVEVAHPRTILTNDPLVLYYLRRRHPVYDRPFNLGRGQALTCARPCLVIDDLRVLGGTPRQVLGRAAPVGRYELTLEP